jgi:hypothetical protein
MDLRYLLFLLLFLLIIKVEGFIDIYQDNKNQDNEYPDDKQFFPIHNNLEIRKGKKFGKTLGNNNYKLIHNTIMEPQHGVYSAFLDVHKLRTYDNFFHSPITSGKTFNDVSYDRQYNYKVIGKGQYNKDVFETEKENDETINNPYYLYGSAKMDPNDKYTDKILYSDELTRRFLKIKNKTNRYENVSHSGDGYNGKNGLN